MSTSTKIPYRRYLQILLLANNSDDDIKQSFARRKLTSPSKSMLAALKKELWDRFDDELKTFYARTTVPLELSALHPKAKELMASLGIDDATKNRDGFTAAKMIFDQVDLRVCAYAHLLSKQAQKDLETALGNMTKYDLHTDAVGIFQKYFCDMNVMDYPTWKDWVYDLRAVNFFEAEIYAACFNSRYPFDLIRWKIHAKLGTQDVDELLKSLTVYTYYKTLEAIESADDSDYERVHSWIEKFLKSYEKHKTFGKGKLGNDAIAPVEEALFQLRRVRSVTKNVTELGENVTQLAAPVAIIDTSKKKKSAD